MKRLGRQFRPWLLDPVVMEETARRAEEAALIDEAVQHVSMVAQAVGLRIVSGVTDEHIARKMGLVTPNKHGNLSAKALRNLPDLVRTLEIGLAGPDTTAARLQRYCRAAGMRFDMMLRDTGPPQPKLTPRTIALAARSRRRRENPTPARRRVL